MFAEKFTGLVGIVARRAMLALLLAGSAGLASAADVYQVNIDTQGYSGLGSIDLLFGAADAATPVSYASLGSFTGNYGNVLYTEGDVSGSTAGSVVLGTSAFNNELYQAVTLGGKFSFTVSFSGPLLTTAGTGGSSFVLAVYDANGNTLGNSLYAVQFDLLQTVTGATTLGVTADAGLASVSAVPEPAQWMALLAGMLLLTVAARRRRLH